MELARERWLAFLARASQELASSLDFGQTFQSIASLAVPELADACALELQDDEGHLQHVALSHYDESTLPQWRQVLGRVYTNSARPGPRRQALATGRGQLIADTDDAYWRDVAADEEHAQQLIGLGITSLIAAPLTARGRTIGVMTVAFVRESGRRYRAEDIPVVEDLARRSALAVDNARLYQAEREARAASDAARHRLAVLVEASRVLSTSLDFDTTLSNVARVLVPAVADHVVVDLVEPPGRFRRVVSVARPEQASIADELLEFPPAIDDDDHFVVRVLRSGASVYVPNIRNRDGGPTIQEARHNELIRKLSVTSTVMAPLISHEGTIGVLTASTTVASDRHFTADDVTLIEDLANRVAVAVEHARLYSGQRDVALTLQRSLLPVALPVIPGISTAARYEPAAPGVEVGGDWYDVIPLPGGLLAVAMGDVEGRGVPAAARMGQLRNAMLAYAAEGRGPAEILSRLDRLLSEHGPRGMATLVLATLDPETGLVRLANAGHPPPIVAGAAGRARFVEGGLSAPLGALERTRYRDTEFTLDAGSTLVMFTDGVFEDRSEPADLGLERLREALVRPANDLGLLVDGLLRAGRRGRRPADDAAVLALRFESLGRRLELTLPADGHILASLRATLRRWLTEAGAAAEEGYEIVLAAGEACANAVEHAYGPWPSQFEVTATVDDGLVQIIVADRGRWRTARSDLRRGRGRAVMEAFVDRVDVTTSDLGTIVTLVRQLAAHRTASGADV
jgi:GAF domain-containing protein/anti-sigma regulatory factor (Ser/Thr protein kinase)